MYKNPCSRHPSQVRGSVILLSSTHVLLIGSVKLLQSWPPAFNEAVSLVMARPTEASFDKRKAAIVACSVGLYCSRSNIILCGSVGSWLTRQVVDGSSELSSEVMAALKFRRHHLQGSDQWKTHWSMLLNAVGLRHGEASTEYLQIWRQAISKGGVKDASKLSSTLCKGVGVQLNKGGHEELAAAIKVCRIQMSQRDLAVGDDLCCGGR